MISLLLLLFVNLHSRICLLTWKRGEGRDREIVSVWETSRICPSRGWNHHPRYVPWPRLTPPPFLVCRLASNQLSHPARAGCPFLKINLNPNFMIHAKIYSKWITDLHMKTKAIKILKEENRGISSQSWRRQRSLKLHTKRTDQKRKDGYIGLP